MYVWEMIAHRLRTEGWSVWHSRCQDACGETHIVHLHRSGIEWQACGPTLTEAFAEASRRVRELTGPPARLAFGHHFGWHPSFAG
jgi:hypothetical protein